MSSVRKRIQQHILRLERLESREVPTAGYFRFVSYNVTASGGSGVPAAGLDTILQGIGNEVVGGQAAPIDLIALQEVDAQTTTSQSVVNLLNGLYGAGMYARGSLDGAGTGSGTQGVVFNQQKFQLLSEAAIGVASTTGQPRQALRYKFHPIGYQSSADFYVYNSHYKADDGSDDQMRRLVEAEAIRADADALGNGVQVLYVGDFNAYRSSETFYQHLLSAGPGQAFDPINRPGNWHDGASFVDIFTQAPAVSPPGTLTGGGLDDRFDFQLISGEFTDGVGIDYAAGTYRTFGVNGSVALNENVNDSSSTALPGLSNRLQILDLLTTVADHLPVVADFKIVGANLLPSMTALVSSVNPSNLTQSVTFTATVSGTGGTPSGLVTFLDGFNSLGSVNLVGGVANFTTNALSTGAHSMSAVYSGDSVFATSTSAPLLQNVNSTYAQFQLGNLVVLSVGNGSSTLNSNAAPLNLLEFTRTGTSVRSVPLPSTGSSALTVAGNAKASGFLSLSADGHYLSLAGVNAPMGTVNVETSSATTYRRGVIRVDGRTNIFPNTLLSTGDYSGLGISGAATVNGSAFWTWGSGASGNTGLRYIPYGASGGTPATQLQTRVFAPRQLAIVKNQLYLASSFLTSAAPAVGLLDKVGNGLPTTSGQSVSPMPGFPQSSGPSPYGFVLLDLNPSVAGVDAAYVADDRAVASGGGLQKWLFNGSTWVFQYTLTTGLTAGLRALTGTTNSLRQAVLYATSADSATKLVAITDTGSTAGFSVLAVAPANTAFRGIAFAPGPKVVIKNPPLYGNETQRPAANPTAPPANDVAGQIASARRAPATSPWWFSLAGVNSFDDSKRFEPIKV